MLKVKVGLLRHLMRQLLPVTLVGLPVACLYVLLWRDVLRWRNEWALVFILIHGLVLTQVLGRFRKGSFGFLYTRGYSRNSIWAHTMLASVLAVLAVWAPAAIIVWTPLRGVAQDALFRSPFFPVMAPREASVPLAWLILYGLLVPAFHYAWIRSAQPARGGSGGAFVAAGLCVTVITVTMVGYRPE